MKFDPNCIFCKIADHKIPANILYEDDQVMAFLDVNPVSYGHCLVITKEHYDSMLSCPKEILHKVYDLAQRLGQVQIKSLGAKGVNILANCYEAAGQTVPHFHVHIIPRYDAPDGLRLEMNKFGEVNLPAIIEKYVDEIK